MAVQDNPQALAVALLAGEEVERDGHGEEDGRVGIDDTAHGDAVCSNRHCRLPDRRRGDIDTAHRVVVDHTVACEEDNSSAVVDRVDCHWLELVMLDIGDADGGEAVDAVGNPWLETTPKGCGRAMVDTENDGVVDRNGNSLERVPVDDCFPSLPRGHRILLDQICSTNEAE